MRMKNKNHKVAVASWTEYSKIKKMPALQFLTNLMSTIMFNTNKTLKVEEQYAFLLYTNRAKDILDAVYIGRVKEVENCVNMPGIRTYDFIFQDELKVCEIAYSKLDGEPISISIPGEGSKKRKKRD